MARKYFGGAAAFDNDHTTFADVLRMLGNRGPIAANRWFQPWGAGQATAGSAFVSGTSRYYPFLILRPQTIKSISFRVTTVASGVTFEWVISPANADGTYNAAATPIASATGLSAATAGQVSTTVSLTLAPGIYWVVVGTSAAGPVFSSFVPGAAFNPSAVFGSTTVATAQVGQTAYSNTTYTYGTANFGNANGNPAPTESNLATAYCPMPVFQAATTASNLGP